MKIKLAEALLRRKELQEAVDRLRKINTDDLFVVKTGRKQAHEGIDDIIASVPKVSLQQVTHAFNWHAKQLRRVDAAIQQANWVTEIDLDAECMEDHVDPYVKD